DERAEARSAQAGDYYLLLVPEDTAVTLTWQRPFSLLCYTAIFVRKTLGWDAYDYINALPLTAVREIHITGIQRLDAYWLNQLAAAGANLDTFAPFAGEPIDHLPMTESDWPFLAWALAEIEAERWGRPSIAAYEYGGIGAVYEAITDGETLAAQLPRMYEMVKTQLVPGTAAITSWSSR
ncbi:MAG: hypothetical protein R6X32_19390, partial [Chloroflexota bacterium]